MLLPTEIRKLAGGAGMKLSWSDMGTRSFTAQLLRQQCPCAACRHELTGEQLLDPTSVPADLTIAKSEIVGQYALGFHFSDGHSTGIYTFDYLRKV